MHLARFLPGRSLPGRCLPGRARCARSRPAGARAISAPGIAALAGLALLAAGAVRAEAPAVALILDSFGVYCAPEGPTRRVPAPGTQLGYIHVTDADPRASAVTTTVPAALGIGFGVALRAAGDGPVRAEFRVSHPDASGVRITETWPVTFSPAGPSLNRFRFEFDHELNTGRWLMEVHHRGQRLFSQAFDVVAPAAAPGVMALCSGTAPMS